MTWYTWLSKVSKNDTPYSIAKRVAVQPSTVTRWRDGAQPNPVQAASAARAYGRPVLEAFIAAGFLTEQEARYSPPEASPSDFSSLELLDELRRRVNDDRVLMSTPHATLTPTTTEGEPTKDDFDLAAGTIRRPDDTWAE